MKKLTHKTKALTATVVGLALAAPFAMAQVADPVETAITDAKESVLTYVALGGAAVVTIALAGFGYGLVVKLIRRMKGAA